MLGRMAMVYDCNQQGRAVPYNPTKEGLSQNGIIRPLLRDLDKCRRPLWAGKVFSRRA
jgi:hypothetical protein